jgi:predicted heme/steroid binding protein/uncharacterized membrane protein
MVKSYTSEDLAQMDGEQGRPAFVAVNGKVYDVSASERWPQGFHMKRHRAGADLSVDIQSAPHDLEVLERFPLVGTLSERPKEPIEGLKGKIYGWLDDHPFFRRHPHPAVVHIPVGLFTVLPLFQIAALLFQSVATEWAALCVLITGTVSIPAAMATGYFTWWVNYDLVDSATIAMKRRCAWIALPFTAVTLLFRVFLVQDPIAIGSGATMIYSAALLASAFMVGCIGFLGGKLTFPYEKKK